MAKVDRKKLLKEPDEFLTLSGQVIRWGKGNLNKVLWSATAVALIVAAVLGFKTYLDWREQKAAAELAGVMTGYAAAVDGKLPQDKTAKLAADLTKVTDQYGSTPAGMQARLALGDLRLGLGQWEQAQKVFASLTEEGGLGADLAPLAYHGLGQALEGREDYKQAAQVYAQAIAAAGPNLGQIYKLDRARVLAASGDSQGAAAIYKEILGQPAGQAVHERARGALAALGQEVPAES
ncbi:tetratricopeptide repeat protein [Desulfoferula mesophila]|uniref:Tetratricopeptide repeat-like domain-containing protein n=1 Tax=Desulfoferula mesophila TaxID=3058419 RepID=A0AAU9ETW1_9BACT|nr:hypothetical protein FAK_03090 [Desulfoferula mesophilus]